MQFPWQFNGRGIYARHCDSVVPHKVHVWSTVSPSTHVTHGCWIVAGLRVQTARRPGQQSPKFNLEKKRMAPRTSPVQCRIGCKDRTSVAGLKHPNSVEQDATSPGHAVCLSTSFPGPLRLCDIACQYGFVSSRCQAKVTDLDFRELLR